MKFHKIKSALQLNVCELISIFEGGNSKVLKVRLLDESFAALKIYQGTPDRINRMLVRETTAINFLNANQIHNIPEILESRSDLGLLAYKWIEGKSPPHKSETMEEIISLCLQLYKIQKYGANFDFAIDSAFSVDEIIAQIKKRVDRVLLKAPKFISQNFSTMLDLRLQKYKIFFRNDKIFNRSTLSISDFGTHNMLISNSSYSFIDFEFFGRDSFEKMTGDFLLHPRNEFESNDISAFIEKISHSANWDYTILYFVLPLLTLKWAVITFEREMIQMERFNGSDITSYSNEHFISHHYLNFFDYLISSTNLDVSLTFRSFLGTM